MQKLNIYSKNNDDGHKIIFEQKSVEKFLKSCSIETVS